LIQPITVRITSREKRFSNNTKNDKIIVNRNNLIKIPKSPALGCKQRHVMPNVLLFNARSIFKKKPKLVVVIEQHKSDIILETETWLTDDVPTNQ
jgi:hypothetical protein